VRLFVALNLPDAVRQAVWESASPLRDLTLPVRWVRPDGIHLTLKFLGDVPDEREAELIAALARAAGSPGTPGSRPGSGSAGSDGITVTLGGFGAFPDVQRPRVLWIGIAPEPALELLEHRVEQQFAPLGFPTEARPFRPHLTLARAQRDARVSDFQSLAAALDALRFDQTVTIATVDLMQSTLQSSGAVYHTRHRERLS
jgi:RNA 2',3'-cyclic 3'-phosphodiesterase